MPFDFFLAQTAAQIGKALPKDAKSAWMACHFSPYNTGLSNLPPILEAGSMLIVNDLMPVANHDPQRITAQLSEMAVTFRCSRVLLDFQRPAEARTAAIARTITQGLPCPVGVSEVYAGSLDCAVFLSPLPLHKPLDDHIAPWQGRPIWLELMPSQAQYVITQDGCHCLPSSDAAQLPFFDDLTCSRYGMEVSDNAIRFTLRRGQAELNMLRQTDKIQCFVGLYQEFAQPEAQATAFSQ